MSATLLLYCRFCAEQKLLHELIDLTSDQRARNVIVEKLSIFKSHSVDFFVKTLPETVCVQCVQALDSAHVFLTKINTSQVVLSNLISTILKVDNKNTDHIFDGSEITDVKISYECPMAEEIYNKSDFEDSIEDVNSKVFADSPMTWSSYSWVCKHCNEEAKSLSALREHSKKYHGVCFGLKCVDCAFDFVVDYEGFIEHVKGHRSYLNQYCHHCNIKLDNSTDHLQLHKNQPQCYLCGEAFADDFTLLTHLTKYQKHVHETSWKEYDWVCGQCNTQLPNLDSLRIHVKEVHNKCFAMQCADCPEAVESFNAFVDHVREHRPSLKFYCQYCNCKFIDAQHTIIHLSEHMNNQCERCGQSFPQHQSLRSHKNKYDPKRKLYSKKTTLTEEDLTCNICFKVAKSINNLQAHKTVHTDRKREYTCDRCGKAFYTKGTLNTHHIIHENPEPQVCEICKKTFLTITRLKKHVKTHCAERNFQCDHCHKCFRSKYQLRQHMICHSDEMPFSCQYCGKTFRHRNVLKIHWHQHTGARPYSCAACPMRFSNWSNRNKHAGTGGGPRGSGPGCGRPSDGRGRFESLENGCDQLKQGFPNLFCVEPAWIVNNIFMAIYFVTKYKRRYVNLTTSTDDVSLTYMYQLYLCVIILFMLYLHIKLVFFENLMHSAPPSHLSTPLREARPTSWETLN